MRGKGAIITGFVLAAVVAVCVNNVFGNPFGFNELPFARWFHTLSGVMWIGLLYYFNVAQIPALAAANADQGGPGGAGVNKYIAPRALLWFRWAAVVTWRHQHLRMDMLLNALPAALQTVVRICEAAVLVALSGLVVWQSGSYAQKMFMLGEKSTAAEVPMWIPQIGYSLGLVILLIAFITIELPAAYQQISSAFHAVHPELEEAGRMLGASRLRTLADITAPLDSTLSGSGHASPGTCSD